MYRTHIFYTLITNVERRIQNEYRAKSTKQILSKKYKTNIEQKIQNKYRVKKLLYIIINL